MSEARLLGVLITYRRPDHLTVMLERLAEQDMALARLVVVDNGRSSQTAEIVRRRGDRRSRIECISAPENLGPAGGIALGMEHLLAHAGPDDWIVLLDDDDPPGWPSAFGELFAFAQEMHQLDGRTAGVGLSGARLDWKRGRLIRPRDMGLTGLVTVDYIAGNQLPFYLAAAVRKVGTFSSALFFGFEELEYGLRIGKAGYRLYSPGSRWLEQRSDAPGGVGRPMLGLGAPSWRRYYSLRNLIHILREHGRTRAAARVTAVQGFLKPLANMARSPRMAWRHLGLNMVACRDGWTTRLGRTLDPEALL
jgi:glycosyltransferase involved in cell wall biosynthesis